MNSQIIGKKISALVSNLRDVAFYDSLRFAGINNTWMICGEEKDYSLRNKGTTKSLSVHYDPERMVFTVYSPKEEYRDWNKVERRLIKWLALGK